MFDTPWFRVLFSKMDISRLKSYQGVWVSPPKLHTLEPAWEIAEWFCDPGEWKKYDENVRKPSGTAPPAPGK